MSINTSRAHEPAIVTVDDVVEFERDGFLVKRGFFDRSMMESMQRALAQDPTLRGRSSPRADGSGGTVEIALWNVPGDDALGMTARSRRLTDAAAALLDDEVYHYHSKLNNKAPGSKGSWIWHQDYGYWYGNGCLFPTMLTVAIPLSPSTADNGALCLLRGSNRAGRIEHGVVASQTGADLERVAHLERQLDTIVFEADPGDVCFFHCNTLHTSGSNDSAAPRDLLLVAYNTKSNDPVIPHHHPNYQPLDVVDDDRIVAARETIMGDRRHFGGEG